ncbi:pyridoxamine 5'-phosphate oxidase family protein [Terrabacter sp. MAHUQ-38]|jgi:nitroimidazol reductase NimA-like FMN-containing flavoprotein (pyridoxamine 5'-phosphate oxidase superfamily)|uniref:pyridoxamine 5'-phosphate oxidase family protein n=1 Tax=unclassified Terrabacter TaxID=2630222 RepID=UPI00165D632D|nr:pyridoxamine 5'-phosphate oxidase family protein [Terrabacter sp. MAHUQ-38]MBC9820835.1 pyridoxamine 5'-phosphate oxidase family protein [Terrabacter sp. MAHUQ-38]
MSDTTSVPVDDDPVDVLHPEQSWGFLREREFGRLAYHLLGEVHIVPINYALDGERLVFLTAEGSKLFGVTANPDVAFEVDEVVGDHATSVICRGRAHVLEGQAAYVAERLPVRPWVDTPRSVVVAIEVDEISGRRFRLTRPWLRDLSS